MYFVISILQIPTCIKQAPDIIILKRKCYIEPVFAWIYKYYTVILLQNLY